MRIGGVCIVLAVAAIVGAGCGGGGKSDEDQVSDVIEQTATTSSKENCTDLETQRFVEQNTFSTGQAAVKSCIDDTGSDADSVKTTNVKVDGEKATATVAVTGSTFDGQTLKVSLVKTDDQWKMDHLDDIVDFDQQQFAKAFEAALTEGDNPLPADQAKCIASGFANASADDAKTVILSGQAQALEPVFEKCGVGG
jgi:hypothetical protein